jgi:ribosomal protein S27E
MRPRPSRSNLDQRERAAANRRKWNEERVWQIKCPACGHAGMVFMTLRRLREVNLKCSACAEAQAEA